MSWGYASRVVDIKRVTKNPNPGFLFLFFVRGAGSSGEGGRAG